MLKNILNALREGFKAIIDRPKTQIPEFDGLRSLAVLLVISTHAGQIWTGLKGQSSSFLKLPFVQGGWVGVDLFFCLSGFFIGRQLWKEYLNTKTILPIQFIMRRGLRIWPLFYTVLILNGLYIAFTKGITFNEIWPELFLVSNYFSGNLVPGSWSLSTEEQFYLVIPLLVLLVSNHFKSIKPGFWFFVLLFFLAPLIRLITWQFTYEAHFSVDENIVKHIYFPFHTHIDGLLMGLMLSNLEVRGIFKEKKSFIKGLMIVLIGFIWFLLFRKFSKTFFAYTSLSFLFGSVIAFILITEKNMFGKLLSNKIFYLISKLSFGMYLTHQFAMHEIAKQVNTHFSEGSDLIKFLLFFTLSTLASMIISFFGFSLIEQPFLKLRSKLGLEH